MCAYSVLRLTPNFRAISVIRHAGSSSRAASTSALNGVTTGSQCAQVTAVQAGNSGHEAADWPTVAPIGTVTTNEACVRGHIPFRLNRNTGLAYARLILSDRLINRDPFWVAVAP